MNYQIRQRGVIKMNINEELLKLEEIYNIIDFQEFYTGIAFLLGLIIFTVFTFSKWDSKYEFYKKEIMSLTEELDYINEESYIKNDKDTHILDEINNDIVTPPFGKIARIKISK